RVAVGEDPEIAAVDDHALPAALDVPAVRIEDVRGDGRVVTGRQVDLVEALGDRAAVGAPPDEIARVARDVLEGAAREVCAEIARDTPRDERDDAVSQRAAPALEQLGLRLVSLRSAR